LLGDVIFRIYILEAAMVRERYERTAKIVPSSPNLSPAFAASWNGVPLKGEAKSG